MSTPCGACLSSVLYVSLFLFVLNYLIIVFTHDDVSVEQAVNRDSLDWSEDKHRLKLVEPHEVQNGHHEAFFVSVGLWHPEQTTFLRDGVLTLHAELVKYDWETDSEKFYPLDVQPCTRDHLKPTYHEPERIDEILEEINNLNLEYMCISPGQYGDDPEVMQLYGNHWEDWGWHGYSNLRFWFEANPDLCMGYDGSLDSLPEDISFCKLSRSEQFGRFR